jgi:hypothetical protein
MKMTMTMIVMMIVKLSIKEDDVHRRMNGATASLSLRTNSSDKPFTRLYRSSGVSGGDTTVKMIRADISGTMMIAMMAD